MSLSDGIQENGLDIKIETQEEPEVYFMEDLTYDDRYKLYSEEILGNVLCSEVDKALVQYVVNNVEPVGWKAIWRSTPYTTRLKINCDFLVQVKDVSQSKLEADIEVLSLLPSTDFELVKIHKDDVANVFQIQKFTAPLTELYPTYLADNEDFEKTAIAIENVRFFYEHLWHPWDDSDEEDYIFAEKFLPSRLKFYYDVQKGIVSYQTAVRIKNVLKEAKEISNKIEQMQDEMNISDSELDIKEPDLIKCLELNKRLDDLRREAQLLENPQLAMFIHNHCSPKNHSPHTTRAEGYSVYHIVAKVFTVKLLQEILKDLPDNAVVEFHKSFEAAVVKCYEDDVILLQPGNYHCRALDWLENSIIIKGLGNTSDETIISSIENEGIFINCKAATVKFINVKIHASKSMTCGLMIHHGLTIVDNCSVTGGQVGIIAINGAQVNVSNSNISNTKIAGIDLRSGSSACLDKNKIHLCGTAGIILQIDDTNLKQIMNSPKILVKNNTIKDMFRYAIVVSTVDCFDNSKNLCFEEDEQLFQWLERKKILENNSITGKGNNFAILFEVGDTFMREKITSVLVNSLK